MPESVKDYIGMIKPEDGDRVDYGVKGMKWGVRRTPAQLQASTASGGKVTADAPKNTGSESSSQRYARLKAQAKAGKGSAMSDEELKWFNARTEALSKVNKLNEQRPGWIKTTTKTVLQNAAQRQMQSVADGIASKYISDPIIAALKDNSAAIKAESNTPVDYVGKRRAKK